MILSKAAHVLMLTFGLSLHELCITGGFYFSHSELVKISIDIYVAAIFFNIIAMVD